MNNNLVEFREYAEKYEKICKGFEEQLEAEILTFDEVREKKEIMNKKLEKLVLKVHTYSIKQMTGKDNRWCTTVKST